MAALVLPDWFVPSTFEFGLARQTVQFRSPISGRFQAVDLLSDYWTVAVTLPPSAYSDAGKLEAFLNQLVGGGQSVLFYHLRRPVPVGTLRGSPVLASYAAQFANQIELSSAFDTSVQNMLTYSEQFDNAAWTKTNSTITADATTAPDGTTSADKLVESSSTGEHYVLKNGAPLVAGDRNTISIYAKAGERGFITGYCANRDLSTSRVRFNLSTGASTTISSGANLVVNTASNVGGGWWRISYTVDGGTGGTAPQITWEIDTGSSYNYAGDGTSGVYVWGAQISQSGSVGEYVKTTSSAAYKYATLKAGDMLGLNGQLLQVANDVTGASDGTMTVDLVNRLRSSVSSGTSVTWNKPTAEFVSTETASKFVHNVESLAETGFSFVEAV